MTETIRGDRAKALLLLIGCIVLFAMCLWVPGDESARLTLAKWAGTGLFGLGIPVAAYQLYAPPTLTLDDKGFTYVGIFGRRLRVAWEDVEGFKLWQGPRGPKMLAWNYKSGRRPNSIMGDLSSSLGADGGLPNGLALAPARLLEKMIARLEASRA